MVGKGYVNTKNSQIMSISANFTSTNHTKYCIAGKFGKSYMIHQSKTIHISTNLLADLLIHQILFCQILMKRVNLPNFPTIQ